MPPKRRSSQPEETQKAIVRLTLEGRSPSDINVLLEQGGFRNSTPPLFAAGQTSEATALYRILADASLCPEAGATEDGPGWSNTPLPNRTAGMSAGLPNRVEFM